MKIEVDERGGQIGPHKWEDADGYVIPELRLVHTPDEVVGPDGDEPVSSQLKFFSGYAGWAAGQLDNEMEQAAWLTHAPTVDLVFHARPEELWKTILRDKGPQYRLLAETPDDVSRN